MKDEPAGWVVALVSPQGHVVAAGTDFGKDHPGGFKLSDAQKMRATQHMVNDAAVSLCNSDFAEAMQFYDKERTIRRMCEKDNYRIVSIRTGEKTDDP